MRALSWLRREVRWGSVAVILALVVLAVALPEEPLKVQADDSCISITVGVSE